MNTSNAGLWDSIRSRGLQWLPERGFGWYPVVEQPYDAAYWARYRKMDRTAVGTALTEMRCALVAKYSPRGVADIGIGGGRFVEDFGARGFDINPNAVDWLKTSGRWIDPYAESIDLATFWDSLEHIHDPAPLLANVERIAIVSLPIFLGCEDVLRSKHYRKDEHCWYFTARGFESFMSDQGFNLLERNTMEQNAGREQIETFVFERNDAR